MRSLLRSVVLWVFGGAQYFLLEVAWKLARGHPGEISWTMLVLAAVVCVPLDQINERMPWDMPLWMQALFGGIGITGAELAAGGILNLWLGLGVWDYSRIPCNLWGQICLPFSLLWVLVAGIGIVLFDWLRFWLYGEPRPNYYWR